MVSIMFHIHYNVQGRRRIYFTRRLFITYVRSINEFNGDACKHVQVVVLFCHYILFLS